MITIRRGDMFAEEVDALVNPVNCVGVMGAGVALEFKKRWPWYYNNYVNDCFMERMKIGQVMGEATIWPSGRPVHLISFPTKMHWRDQSYTDTINVGINSLGEYLDDHENIRTVAVPALGCGRGGLRWDVVMPIIMILDVFVPEIDIRLYEPRDQ